MMSGLLRLMQIDRWVDGVPLLHAAGRESIERDTHLLWQCEAWINAAAGQGTVGTAARDRSTYRMAAATSFSAIACPCVTP